jgi:hypothetical protein
MPIKKSDADALLKGMLDGVQGVVKSHVNFLFNIFEEDDWSFVIKSHALVEAAMTQLLVDSVGDERFKRIFERLPLSDDESGKLAVAKELGLLEKDHRRFVRFFSTLRNSLVHRVENVGFLFEPHIAKMDPAQKKSWQDSIIWFPQPEETRKQWREIALKQPKIALLIAVYRLVVECSITSSQLRTTKSLDKLALETGEELLSRLSPK